MRICDGENITLYTTDAVPELSDALSQTARFVKCQEKLGNYCTLTVNMDLETAEYYVNVYVSS